MGLLNISGNAFKNVYCSKNPLRYSLKSQFYHFCRKANINIGIVRSTVLAFLFFSNFVLQTIANVNRFNSNSTTYQKLHELILPAYSFTIFVIYAYFLVCSQNLRSLIEKLVFISKQQLCVSDSILKSHYSCDPEQGINSHKFNCNNSSKYPRFCLITLILMMVYGIIENVAYDVQNLLGADAKLANSTLQRYYLQSFYHWTPFFAHKSYITLTSVILLKLGTYAWIFGDILVIVLCRAVTERLRILNEETVLVLQSYSSLVASTSKQSLIKRRLIACYVISWDEIRRQYMTIQNLVGEMGKFVSPLMLSCYGINIYLIIINVLLDLYNNLCHTDYSSYKIV